MSKNKPKDTGKKTTVGGQALIEGVMMKGVSVGSMAVRKKDGDIHVEQWELPQKKWYNKAPFIRGCFNFVQTLKEGYTCMNKSIDISGMAEDDEDEEPSKFDLWLDKHVGEKGMEAIAGLMSFLMIAAMLAVFLFVPSFLFSLLEGAIGEGISPWKSTFEGVLKLLLFIAYMAIIAQMKTMKRVYEYHGAEHKTIFCLENRKELTVENVRGFCRLHPRCGTSFLLIVFFTSIVFSILISAIPVFANMISGNIASRMLYTAISILFIPIIAGLSYELQQYTGRHDNLFTKIVSAPGLAFQKITTKEPSDDQIEVAIAAIKASLTDDEGNFDPSAAYKK